MQVFVTGATGFVGLAVVREWIDAGTTYSASLADAEEVAAKHGVKSVMFRRQPNTRELSEIAGLIDPGSVTVVVGTVLPLSEAACAQQLSQAGHVRGKTVLKVA